MPLYFFQIWMLQHRLLLGMCSVITSGWRDRRTSQDGRLSRKEVIMEDNLYNPQQSLVKNNLFAFKYLYVHESLCVMYPHCLCVRLFWRQLLHRLGIKICKITFALTTWKCDFTNYLKLPQHQDQLILLIYQWVLHFYFPFLLTRETKDNIIQYYHSM